MKITIEAETDAEREQRPSKITLVDVVNFAVVGDRRPAPEGEPSSFSHTHFSGPNGLMMLLGALAAATNVLCSWVNRTAQSFGD